MISIEVAVSGSVGKQVVGTPVSGGSGANRTSKARLDGLTLSPSAANATIKIRDGNASGDVVFFARALSALGSRDFEIEHDFTKGMHVKVIGSNAVAYLNIE